MTWLETMDVAVFRWVNQAWANPWLDAAMPWLSGNPLFAPALVLIAAWLLWRGGTRGRVCVVMLLLLTGALNNLVVDELKDLFARPRPFSTLSDVRLLVGRGGSYGLPSSHVANWFAALAVVLVYYRRAGWFLLPWAVAVSISRVYNGAHYPSDVLVGVAVGWIVGRGGLWVTERVWRFAGRRWFPLWWRQLSSLTQPQWQADPLVWRAGQDPIRDPAVAADRQWLYLGYVLIVAMWLGRLVYLGADKIDLSKDEAYQWLWSKHLALSYYSKPPMIAYFQFAGRTLWGDTELGVRFFAPLITAFLSWLLLRFFAREVNARAGFWLVLTLSATPLMAMGSILFTIDSPSVLFWGLAMLAGWRALRRESRTRDWLWLGLALGLGFLSKYTAVLQWISLILYFWLWPAARVHLRRPGPYLALGVNLLCTIPVVIWNLRHGWITVVHLHDRAGLTAGWQPTARYLLDFTGAELALLNPVFFGAIVWAVIAVWRHRRGNALWLYFLVMGVPLFLMYWVYTLRARVQPNWIAPAVLPLFCLMVAYSDSRWRGGLQAIRRWLIAGLAFGLPVVIVFHDSNLIGKLTGKPPPPKLDPLRRVRGWKEAAQVLDGLRRELAAEGKPVFVIGEHYGITSLFSFYLPGSREVAGRDPFVYVQSSDRPQNQFYFWPGYQSRKGQNAIYVVESDTPEPPPERLVREFASVTDLGVKPIEYRGRVLRRLQFFACRDLR